MNDELASTKSARLESWLGDMLTNAEAIERYVNGITQQEFLLDEMRQDAVVRRIEIIGEAADRIMKAIPDYAATFPDLPLRIAKDTRNLLIHEYQRVSPSLVWKTAIRDIPSLRLLLVHAIERAKGRAG